ncbi:MAG: hypothetical protein ACJAWC_000180 [Yoonia sp.]
MGGFECLKSRKKWIERFRSKKGLARRFFRRERFWLSFVGLIILLLSVVILWLLWALFTYTAYEGPETSGPAGDKFGGITALFSGLAFAGLIFTLFVQKKELQYQREELTHLVSETRETKQHLEAQANHLKSQSDFVGKQTFENSFFQMMASLNQFISGMTINIASKSHQGTDALEVMYRGINYSYATTHSIEKSYEYEFNNRKNDLAPYYRQMYNILKFIDLSGVQNKKFYANLLRAQLASCELSLLVCNGASAHGKTKMAPLMKKYEILKHFDDTTLFKNSEHLQKFYGNWSFYKSNILDEISSN